jgi:uncharacterized heparinase superfamily protein
MKKTKKRPTSTLMMDALSPKHLTHKLLSTLFPTKLYQRSLKWGRISKNFRNSPHDLWPGDAGGGADLLRHICNINCKQLTLSDPIWPALSLDLSQQAHLHRFSWLRDLRALGSDPAKGKARQLVADWLISHGTWQKLSWRPDILSERLSNWLISFEFLTGSPDSFFAQTLRTSIVAQARHLNRVATWGWADSSLFDVVKGQMLCGMCIPGNQDSLEAGFSLLAQEIKRQILPDGGHFQRSPSIQLQVMRRLIEIREILQAAALEVPIDLQTALDRMGPMLRSYRLSDGSLGLFNGGTEEDSRAIDIVFGKIAVKGKALSSAPHTGFQRIAAGRTLILMDTGGAPPQDASHNIHAGALSFEMCIGKQKLIVNCGSHAGRDDAWALASRTTAAHSTVCVNDTNSLVLPTGPVPLQLARETAVQRREADGNIWLEASHEGYKSNFGLIHRRKLYLGASGADFRGEDNLLGNSGKYFAVRFHLHPHAQASLVQDGKAVLLRVGRGKGQGWNFRASGGSISLEASIYLGKPGEPRHGNQIVVAGVMENNEATVKWRFEQIST